MKTEKEIIRHNYLDILANAINTDDVKMFRQIVESYPNLLTTQGVYWSSQNPLHLIASEGAVKCLEYLIVEKEIPISLPLSDQNQTTALNVAIYYGYETIAELLLKYGANVNSIDDKGTTPLYTAVEKGNVKLIKLLVEQEGINIEAGPKPPLHIAANMKHEEIIRILLKKGAKVDTNINFDESSNYPLQIEKIKFLAIITSVLLADSEEPQCEVQKLPIDLMPSQFIKLNYNDAIEVSGDTPSNSFEGEQL